MTHSMLILIISFPHRYGLNDDLPTIGRTRRSNAGGFVDLGNEYEYGAGGHHASGANEIFADEQGDRPWWRTNFFISQPVLFGTWDGVFTTCLINIFGVIVFLRSGWIVAQAGIINAILIIFCSGEFTLILRTSLQFINKRFLFSFYSFSVRVISNWNL